MLKTIKTPFSIKISVLDLLFSGPLLLRSALLTFEWLILEWARAADLGAARALGGDVHWRIEDLIGVTTFFESVWSTCRKDLAGMDV